MTMSALNAIEGQSDDPGKVWSRLAAIHDRLFAESNTARLKHLVTRLGIAGFVIHLLLIFLAKTLSHPPRSLQTRARIISKRFQRPSVSSSFTKLQP